MSVSLSQAGQDFDVKVRFYPTPSLCGVELASSQGRTRMINGDEDGKLYENPPLGRVLSSCQFSKRSDARVITYVTLETVPVRIIGQCLFLL